MSAEASPPTPRRPGGLDRSLALPSRAADGFRRERATRTARATIKARHARLKSAWLFPTLVILAGFSVSTAFAAEALPSGPEPTLRYRKLFVPADEIAKLDRVYLPVKRSEFDQLLNAIQARHAAPGVNLDARLAEATYAARVVGSVLTGGRAELNIVHHGHAPSLLPLEPLGLAIDAPTWTPAAPAPETPPDAAKPADAPAPSAAERSAPPGTSPPAAAQIGLAQGERLVAYVQTTGKLQFAWSLRGKPGPLGELLFDLQLPACPVNHLLLEVPDTLRPAPEHGVARPVLDSPADEGFHKWSIDLGGVSSTILHLIPLNTGWRWQRLVRLRQQTTYRFAPDGTEVRCDLHLDVHHEPLTHLALVLDEPLQLVQAQMGETALRWTSTAAAQAERPQLILEFPEPVTGADRLIKLRAVTGALSGSKMALPGVAVPEAFWQAGQIALEVPQPLVVEQLETEGCRQTGIGPLADPGVGEAIRLQCLQPRAVVRVVVQPRDGDVSVQTGTTLRLSPTSTTAQMVADFRAEGSPRFQLELDAAPPWTIDAVESDPPGRVEAWQVVRQTPKNRRFQIRLRGPLAEGQPLRLLLHAHGRGLVGETASSSEQLRLAIFDRVKLARSLISLGADPPHRVRFTGDPELVRLDPGQLSEEDAKRVTLIPGGVVFAERSEVDVWSVALSRETPNYSAEIHVDALVDDKTIQQRFQIRCVPAASRLERVLIQFSEAMPDAPRWTDSDESRELDAQRLSAEEQQALGISEGETWQVVLPQAPDAPFEVVAQRTSKFSEACSLPLVSLPRATSQVGRVTVRSANVLPLACEPQNLKAVPPEPWPAEQSPTLRAAFRYEPAQKSRLVLSRPPAARQPAAAWAWSGRLTSRVGRDGRTWHSFRYRLENSGAHEVLLSTIGPAEGLQITVDGRPQGVPTDHNATSNLPIALPRGVRFPTLRVEFTTPGSPLGVRGSVAAPWPRLDVPVLARSWTVWLPPGYDRVPAPDSQPPRPWSDRLFGPLLRPALRTSDDARLGSDNSDTVPPDAEAMQAFLVSLAKTWATQQTAAEEQRLTWGGLLAGRPRTTEVEEAGDWHLLIDQEELADVGLTATTPVVGPAAPASPDDDEDLSDEEWATRGAELLHAAHLSLLAYPGGLLLTARQRLALFRPELQSGPFVACAYARRSGGLSQAVQQDTDLRFVSLAAWTAEPNAARPRWVAEPAATTLELADAGWTACSVACPPDPGTASRHDEPRVDLYRPDVVQALGWVAFLSATGLMGWLLSQRRGLLAVPLAAVAGGLALFCAEAAIPVFAGIFLGCLLALVLVLRPRVEPTHAMPDPPSRVSQRSSTFARATALLVLALLFAWAVRPGRAEETPAKPPSPVAADIYRVYAPVAEDQKPEGEYVFLPRVFYDTLHRQAVAAAADQLPWLIRTADYRVAVQDVGADGTGDAVEFVARFELHVFRPGTKVRLPVRSEQVNLVPNRARLDGQLAAVAWAPDGSALEIETAVVGPAVLELAFRPQVARREGVAGFDVQIPRVAHAHVHFEQPVAMKDIQVPTALGGVGLDDKTGERFVELGPADRLAVEWPVDSDLATSATDLEVDQLLWLHVQPHAVLLDAKLTWASLGRPVRQVRLQTDPRLRLLPPAADQPIEQFAAQAGDVPLVSFDLRPPYQKEVAIQVRFLVADTTGIGTLRLPRFQPLADRVRRRWLAVSVSPALALDRPAAAADFVREPAAFAAAWGASETPPQLVLELPAATTNWPLTTQFRATHVTAEQRVEVAFGAEFADVVFAANVQVSDGEVFQHRLRAPKDLLVTSVSVADDKEDRAARWSRDEQGGVIVMLNGPLTAAHRLRLTGKVPLGKLRRTKVPVLVLSGAALRADHVEVYRRPEVQVSLAEQIGYAAAAEARPGEYRKGWGRLVAAWDAQPNGPHNAAIQVNLSPNEPRSRGRLVTELRRDEDAWQAVADYELQPDSGVIDALRFDIPAEWTGPFQVDPPASLETVDLPGRSRRLLVLRPTAAIAQATHLRVRGSLASVPGERVRAPDILPLDVAHVERYLVAPTKLQQREIAWETSGLQEVSLPERYGPPDLPSFVTYQAIGPRFQATIKDVKIESGSPQVRLADVAVQARADGSVLGTATFDLEPAGLTACDLELPEDYELVHVRVAQLPAFAEPLGARHWRLRLFPSQLPTAIEVVFSGTTPKRGTGAGTSGPGGARTLRSPRLLAVPVERTVWTIQGPFTLDAAGLPAEAVSDPWSHELCRLRNVAARVQTATSVLSESDPQELVRWYHPWAWRWSAIHSRLEQWRRQPASPVDRDASELTALDRQQAALTTRLRAAGFPLPAPAHDSARWASEPDAARPDVATYHLQSAGMLDSVTIQPRPARAGHVGERFFAALALLGLALMAFLLLPHPSPNGRIPRWTPLLGACLGLAWWQCCTPPALGLFVSLSSLVAWLTAVWPTRRSVRR